MNNEKYNGWTNYATWRVNLESVIDETTPDGIAKDYALAFVSDVNYYEIAENLIEANNEA